MTFCSKCGAEIPEGSQFCTACGTPVAAPAYVDEADHTAQFDEADRQRNKYLAALCYLSFIFIFIALIAEPNSKFLRFHANQSILIYVLAAAGVVACIVPFLGWLACAVVSVATPVFTIMGIVRACKGEAKEIPIIGKYAILHWD